MSFLDRYRNTSPELFSDDDISFDNLDYDDDEDFSEDDLNQFGDMDDDESDEDEAPDNFDKPSSEELTNEEDAMADSIIDVAATPIVMNEIMSKEAVQQFAESAEFDIAVGEGLLLESSRDSLVEDNSFFMESKFYQKNMVRFTKQARTNQLFEICVQAIARAKNDPMYTKLTKVQALRRKIKGVLRQRYRQPAMKKAKEYIMRLRSSNSRTIANAAAKLEK